MAKLIIDNATHEIADGSSIAEICENVGIPFSCNSGECATCQIEILEGMENLNELNREELALGLDRKRRLSCQCKILSGTVRITY